MATDVIHIRQSSKSPNEVYIGRPGKGREGIFGNPVAIGKACPICSTIHNDGGSTLACYESYLLNRLERDLVFTERFWQLKDKTLVCFCKPKPCHGDIMKKVLDNGPAI